MKYRIMLLLAILTIFTVSSASATSLVGTWITGEGLRLVDSKGWIMLVIDGKGRIKVRKAGTWEQKDNKFILKAEGDRRAITYKIEKDRSKTLKGTRLVLRESEYNSKEFWRTPRQFVERLTLWQWSGGNGSVGIVFTTDKTSAKLITQKIKYPKGYERFKLLVDKLQGYNTVHTHIKSGNVENLPWLFIGTHDLIIQRLGYNIIYDLPYISMGKRMLLKVVKGPGLGSAGMDMLIKAHGKR